MSVLIALSGPDKGHTWPVKEQAKTLIGRVDLCQVCVSDGRASRRHCSISKGPDGLVVEDLDSANGTFVNGARVSRAELHEGDRLRVGYTEFELRAAGVTAAVSQPQETVAMAAPTEPILASHRRRLPASGPVQLQFCTRCAVSIDHASLSSGSARRIDGELLCSECVAAGVTAAKSAREPRPAAAAAGRARVSTALRAASPATATAPAPRLARPARPVRPASTRSKGVKPVGKSKDIDEVASAVKPLGSSRRAAGVPAGRQVWAYLNVAVTLAILGACLLQSPAAWLNFKRMISPSSVGMQQVPVEEVGRTPVSITLSCMLKPENGPEVKAVQSAGIIAKFQYDDLSRQAKAVGGVAKFDVVFDAANPTRSALRDQLFGLPVLIISLIAAGWAAREIWQISKFYRRPATA
jgi:hypothetical protein